MPMFQLRGHAVRYTHNPVHLKRGDLPKKIDKDPKWRAQAIFTRDEVELLSSAQKVPDDRRTLR